jgi:ferredoxin
LKYTISVDREKCIGCGACANTCDNFKLDGDKAAPVKKVVTELGCNQQAADICPVEAISIAKS